LSQQLALEFPSDVQSSCVVRLSKRAKRLSIYLHNSGKLEIVAPERASSKRIQKFIQAHKPWIKKHRAILAQKTPHKEQGTRPQQIELPFLKRTWRIVYRASCKRLIEHDNWLELPQDKSDIEIVKLLGKWLKKQSEHFITPLMQELSVTTGLRYQKLTFRGQKTRWGSCSPKGSINLNYCLLFLSEDYVRYVLIHELCHLEELNHSRAFWNLVKRYQPNYRKFDKKLNDYWVNLPNWLDLRFESSKKLANTITMMV